MGNKISKEPLDGYRQCVGIFLLNKHGLVFVGDRIDAAQAAWQFPQGGIDHGEQPVRAALRELEEEIGTNNAEILKISDCWRSYDFPKDIAANRWCGRFRGQSQKWVALRFIGSDSAIDLEAYEPEFSDWKWLEPVCAINLAVSFKREIYISVVDEFRHLWA